MRIHPENPVPSDPRPEATPEAVDTSRSMEIDIYRASTDRSKLLSVPAGTDLSTIQFPSTLDEDLHSVRPYKAGVTITRGTPALGLDVEDIYSQILAQGFAAHLLKASGSIEMGVRMGIQPR
ncbi:MAG TPA: hypothetical protein PKO15_01000 [Fibrobacteria bacterium]|nr:hypothetical protein [Fibrobacteria bacterium]HOX53673.1 hypothetical protein [Fibrobacteria bacterium]